MRASSSPRANSGIRIVVAASHASVSRSLTQDLESEGFAVCSAEESAPRAVESALAHQPDVFLVTADLQGSAVLAAATITERMPQTKVVVIAEPPDEEDCLMYLLVGASAYVGAGIDRGSLASTLRGVVAGQAIVPPAAQRRLLDELGA
jgi:DNA-binding NarL/FixJ family response regulator